VDQTLYPNPLSRRTRAAPRCARWSSARGGWRCRTSGASSSSAPATSASSTWWSCSRAARGARPARRTLPAAPRKPYPQTPEHCPTLSKYGQATPGHAAGSTAVQLLPRRSWDAAGGSSLRTLQAAQPVPLLPRCGRARACSAARQRARPGAAPRLAPRRARAPARAARGCRGLFALCTAARRARAEQRRAGCPAMR